MKRLTVLLAACAAVFAQTPARPSGAPPAPAAPAPASPQASSKPSDAEQQDLMRAVNEAGNSSIDMERVLEAFLQKYPDAPQLPQIEMAIAKAAVENNDTAKIILYGERVLARTPDDVVLLDRVSQALVALGGQDNAQKAIKYSRDFENIIDGMKPPTGAGATQTQEDRDRALARTLLVQSRARTVLGDNSEAERLASRAFAVYPSEEPAREWAQSLLRLGRDQDALTHLAEAFAVPDAHASNSDRLKLRNLLGELYSKLHNGSEKGLGDFILDAYDRTSSLVETRRQRLLALDPNASAADATHFTITGLDGKKLQMSDLAGKVIVLDFWATWCVPCRAQHPLYENVKKHFGDRPDLVFLSLDTDEDHSLVAPFLKQQKWDSHVYFEDGLSRLLSVDQIPTTILLDKHGKISSRMNGFLPDEFEAQLTERIAAALADNPQSAAKNGN